MSERKVVQVELRAWVTFDVEVSINPHFDDEVEIHAMTPVQRGNLAAKIQVPGVSDLSEDEFASVDNAAFKAFGVMQ